MKKLLAALLFSWAVFSPNAYATTITNPKTWVNGEVLTAADLNNGLNTIYNDYNGSISAANLAATLTFADGDFIDLSAITVSGSSEGIRIPVGTSGTAAGQIAWDSTTSQLVIGNGSAAVAIPVIASAAQGDVMYRNSTGWTRLAAGTAGYVLETLGSGNNVNWVQDANSVLTTQGDILYRDASGLARLGFGTSGQFLKTNGTGANPAWASATPNVFVGTFTRDTTTASGTQAITGVGFTVKAVIFFANESNAAGETSWGLDDGTRSNVLFDRNPVTADAYSETADNTVSIYDVESSTLTYAGVVSTLGSDGFTITWTRGSTPSGTLRVNYLAIG